jgi:SAM-dependent methyltransferase
MTPATGSRCRKGRDFELETIDLQREFEKRGPWMTRFVIHGRTFGGRYDPSDDPRLVWFRLAFPKAESILELGSLEGGHSFPLARMEGVKRIISLEGRKANLKRARFVQQIYQDQKITFIQANLEHFNLAGLGRFDAVFCVGLLYHLPKPWELVEQIAGVSRGLFLWTHYAASGKAARRWRGYPGLLFREWRFLYEPRSGLSPASFWPTLDGLRQMLLDQGFSRIELIRDEPDHEHGPAVTLAARQI